MNKRNQGFTLLEILLVIAAIGILASIVIVAINPLKQIGKTRNAARYSNINTIQKALDQYYIANGRYPEGILTEYQEICVDGDITECVDLNELVPTYIAEIPKDPQGGGYKIAINSDNSKVSLVADKASLEQEIAVNPIILNAGSQDPSFNISSGIISGFAGGGVWTTVNQSDGKVLVGGHFTTYKGVSANKIIRLNSDGS